MEYAGFWRRTAAYLLDIIPIVGLVWLGWYLFTDYAEAYAAYAADRRDLEAKARFLLEYRNGVRDHSFIAWITYSFLMEASPFEGTFGKRLLGLRVTDLQGNRLSLSRSFRRNMAKIPSYVLLGAGFFMVAFTKRKQGLHDRWTGTLVTFRDRAPGASGRDALEARRVEEAVRPPVDEGRG